MSSELTDLYQELLLDHARHPHNFRAMDTASRIVEGYNPLCGDDLKLYLRLEGDRIADISFQGRGCAISTASASMLTDRIKGRTVGEAEQLFDAVHGLLIGARLVCGSGRPRRAGGLGGCEQIPHAGQVRHAELACPQGGPAQPRPRERHD